MNTTTVKRLAVLGTVIAGLTGAIPVSAQTATPSAAATQAPKAKQIENLMDRLATKVAELKQTQKKAVFGKVKAATISTITLETTTKDMKVEMPDDIGVFQIVKGKRTKLTADNVEKGDSVTVFGDYDATLGMLTAKSIFIESAAAQTKFVGVIRDVDKTDYSFVVQTRENRTYTVDFETNSKYLAWDSAKGLVKGGFSKLTVGDVVGVTGTQSAKDETRISAARIVSLSLVSAPALAPSASVSATAKPTPGK